MRQLAIFVSFALVGAVWLQWELLQSTEPTRSFYLTKADTVVCATPFQIRKATVGTAQDDGTRIRGLGCSRPGAGERVRVLSMPATKFGPWEIQLITARGAATPMWSYADQFEADAD
jgi:hypothetical protein